MTDSTYTTLMRCMKANTAGERCRKDYDHPGGHDFPVVRETCDHVGSERVERTVPDGLPEGVPAGTVETLCADCGDVVDDAHLAHARYLGADAALAAASWLEMSESDARSILSDVDPMVMDAYPDPSLREWEDEGDQNLFHEATGVSSQYATPAEVDALAEAWCEGRDAVWSDALQAHALRVLGDIPRALEIERANESYVDTLRAR